MSDTPLWLTPEWPAPSNVRALSTMRTGGVSGGPYASLNLGSHVGDEARAVAENRRRLMAAAHLPAEPQWLAQVHGIEVLDLDVAQTPTQAPGARAASGASAADVPVSSGVSTAGVGAPCADAAFTRRPGRVCAVLTADCLPVLFANDAGDCVAAAHAGWRGLVAGVLEATVHALDRPPAHLMAWLGPAIGPGHFEVGEDVRAAFLAEDFASEAAFRRNARGRYLADLPALARLRLRRAGVERVYGGGACTHAAADRFFSHRRDGITGRQASVIWLEPRSTG